MRQSQADAKTQTEYRREALMNHSIINLGSLFAQLGRDSDEGAIARFIETHAPLPGQVQLHEAGFWTQVQSGFLREAIQDDAEWAEVVDLLDSQLRMPH
jgi:hypothetical protein